MSLTGEEVLHGERDILEVEMYVSIECRRQLFVWRQLLSWDPAQVFVWRQLLLWDPAQLFVCNQLLLWDPAQLLIVIYGQLPPTKPNYWLYLLVVVVQGVIFLFLFLFWHPMLVRHAMKRLFCLKAKNGLIINLIHLRLRHWGNMLMWPLCNENIVNRPSLT